MPGGKGYHGTVPERPAADTKNRFEHDRQNRGLQSKEQRLNGADISEDGVDPAQHHDGNGAGEHEQGSGDQTALGLVHEPADIDCKLLRFRPRQQGAIVQRM